MSCQNIAIGDTLVHINYGPAMKEIRRDSEGVKWCFHCRKRREFFYIVVAPVEPSYYDPNVDIACGHCNTSDGDMFPGHIREWA
jgi:hypothetical protein